MTFEVLKVVLAPRKKKHKNTGLSTKRKEGREEERKDKKEEEKKVSSHSLSQYMKIIKTWYISFQSIIYEHITLNGETMEIGSDFIFEGSKLLQTVTAVLKLKDTCSLEEKL